MGFVNEHREMRPCAIEHPLVEIEECTHSAYNNAIASFERTSELSGLTRLAVLVSPSLGVNDFDCS